MSKMLLSSILLLMVGFALATGAAAQEVTPIPTADVGVVEPAPPSLETVTADPATYAGQEVTLEGIVAELVNVRSFVLSENAALDADQVLVLNNSGQEFNIGLTKDAPVRVTGTVYLSFNGGGWDQLGMGGNMEGMDAAGGEVAVTEAPIVEIVTTAEATDAAMAEAGQQEQAMGRVTLAEYPVVILRDRFPDHTLLVIDSPDDIEFVETDAM